MQLIIKGGVVIATHNDNQDVADKYPDTECIQWTSELEQSFDEDGLPTEIADPRTEEQKKEAYKDKRRVAYPSIQDQLDMIYWDKINSTDTWTTEISRIKALYEKD